MSDVTDINNPQHYTSKALFAKFTWWESCEAVPRVFVITRIETDWNTGHIEKLELLERNKAMPTLRDYEEVVNLFKSGKIRRTSKTE